MMIDRRLFLTGSTSLALTLAARAPAAIPAKASYLTGVDSKFRPGDDFYRYANAPWLARNSIPADKSSWDEFARLSDLNAARVRTILEQAAAHPANADERKFGQFYASLADEAQREALGIAPIAAALARIDAITAPADIAAALAALTRDTLREPQSSRFPGPVAALIFPDIRQPTRYLPTLAQGGIGVPDREAFFADKPGAVALRDAYRTYLRQLFTLAGLSEPDSRAADAYALEERIAGAHRPLLETFDLDKRYNLWSIADLTKRAPGFDWATYLKGVGFEAAPTILVSDPDAIAAVALAARDQPIAHWRAYCAAQTLAAFAPFGPKAFVAAHFAYAGQAVKGIPQAPPVWRQAADTANRAMGPAIGVTYLAQYFPPSARAVAEQLISQVKLAMGKRIAVLTWMTPETKARALKKLAAARIDVGGEARPRDYADLTIEAGAAWRNVTAAANHIFDQERARTHVPLDRGVWEMLPQTVNAQSNPILNKVMFPAGIMQPPLFDPAADPAVNFGAIGMFIGHELSHLFDNIGALFDEDGRMANWWQPADKAHFDAATTALAKQYDGYRPFPDLHLNGRQMLHENVADLAGLTVAHDAYRASLHGRDAPVTGGFTGEQRFFLSFARLWREQIREPAFRQMIAIGTHAHGEWRVATVRNIDAWYAAFAVKPGDALYLAPDQRVVIW